VSLARSLWPGTGVPPEAIRARLRSTGKVAAPALTDAEWKAQAEMRLRKALGRRCAQPGSYTAQPSDAQRLDPDEWLARAQARGAATAILAAEDLEKNNV